jgi:DNA-binding NarL/FixJ family response regulator
MQHVLVIENERLLGAGIENLLRREVDLQVTGVTVEDESALLQAISRAGADVVVLDEATTDATSLLAILENHPRLRVLVVSADGDLVRMYDARQVTVTQATELVALIKS